VELVGNLELTSMSQMGLLLTSVKKLQLLGEKREQSEPANKI